MSVYIPLLDGDVDDAFVSSVSRLGPVIIPTTFKKSYLGLAHYLLLDHDTSLNLDNIVSILDKGAEKVIIPLAWANEVVGIIPKERILILLDVGNVSAVSDRIRTGVSGIVLKAPTVDPDFIASFIRFFSGASVHVWITDASSPPSVATIRELRKAGTIPVIPSSLLTLQQTSNEKLNVADAFVAPLVSDRTDGLFPTVVTEENRSLGLVYSSVASVKESILTGRGVYQSRKHGLWRKGETSGATQDVISIRVDCDLDALEFDVVQHGSGFCHLERASCFGHARGLAALQSTLQSRLASAPEGS